ncbi:MAG: HlyD family efflux transporter periplasmic adaptor subunit [Paraglaciecola sp.]|nr:HlyD family efflux transporter periplasmic adaptor subunit [Paraglaciecola sp.]NCT46442.1 HlyD family efflux transporter periplasmic adaptor subunit [Paraglaciecola sp.]
MLQQLCKSMITLSLVLCISGLPARGFANEQQALLTGVVTSARSQLVTAPRTSRWQVQIQWMADEGSVVQAGDLVVVFDSGGIQAQLEENEQRLTTEQLQLIKIEMDLTQAVTEAQGRLNLANIMVDKTRIEASVPDGQISAYEKGKHQIAYEKALLEKIKAEENLKLKEAEQRVGIDKQNITILKLEEEIAYQRSQMEKLSVVAEFTGPVTHMMHPWMAQKIAIGMNVQASWNIVQVQAQEAYQVSAWLHEIDAARLNVANSELTLALDAYPNTYYTGKLLSMSSQAEQKSQWSDGAYYRLEVAFNDYPKQAIFPGMSVRVLLQENATLASIQGDKQ